LSNKGRKPWNVGKPHSPDTVERIRENTRRAMHRSEVRARWEARWKPSAHTEKTKEKLKAIMMQKEKMKINEIHNWLKVEMGINKVTYENLATGFREAYRCCFNIKWRMKSAKSEKDRLALAQALHTANVRIIEIYARKAERHKQAEERARLRTESLQISSKRKTPTSTKHDEISAFTEKNQKYSSSKNKKSVTRNTTRDKQKSKYIYGLESLSSHVSPRTRKTTPPNDAISQQNMELYSQTLHLYRVANQQLQLIEARSRTILAHGAVNEVREAHNALDKARALLMRSSTC